MDLSIVFSNDHGRSFPTFCTKVNLVARSTASTEASAPVLLSLVIVDMFSSTSSIVALIVPPAPSIPLCLILQTPSDSRLTSFTSACPQSDLSLNSYFNKKSNEMGQLSDELSPSQRASSRAHSLQHVCYCTYVLPLQPQFTDTPSHVILSPTAIDTTPKEPSSIVFNGLTPALSSLSTLPPTPPQLDLSEPTSLDQGLPSMYFHNELPPSNQQTPTGNSVGGLPSQYLQMEQLSLKDTPCHLEASQSLHLCSQYLQPEDSTLVFPELSAISSLPPEAPYSLATPPSAYLPLGFEVTSVGNQLSFTTTATDESVKTITTDASHVTSEEDHVIRHGSPININLSSVSTNISGSCEQSHQVMVSNGSLDVEALLRSQPIDVSSDLSNITTPPPHGDHTPPHTVHTSSTFHTTTTSVHHSPSPERYTIVVTLYHIILFSIQDSCCGNSP